MKGNLQNAIKAALKAKDKTRVETLRSVVNAIQYEEMEKGVDPLPDPACLEVAKRELKKRKEQMEYAVQGKRTDVQIQLQAEIKVLEELLPKQLSGAQIEQIFSDLKKQNPALNLGLAMKALKESYAGQYDSKEASEIAKKLLS